MYQRKYCCQSQQLHLRLKDSSELTWLVQTLLKVTKAKVCASIVLARSFFANNRGIAARESRICGMNARDSIWMPEWEGCWELRCSRVL